MRGFSLPEVLVVMAVLLIISGFTVPIVNRAVNVYRLNSVATQVASNIKSARFAAIRRDALVNWQITQNGNTTTVFVDTDRDGVFDANVQAAIFNTNINVVAGGVPNTAGLAGLIGVGALTPIPPANGNVTFDSRGAVTGVPTAYVVYASDSTNGGAAANYRAVVLMPSGLTQVWMSASNGAWTRLN
jgi:prepilin-type N-terminal cleavage/methylation domain-containing protein